MKNKIFTPVLGAVVLGMLIAIQPAHALTLVPPSLEFSGTPGQTIATKVKLFNETNEVITQYSSTANFQAKDETGTPAFDPESEVVDLASWIALEKGPFTLQPGERLEIPVSINIPADAEPGGHYAGVFFSMQPAGAPNEAGQVGITTKLGTLVLVRVEGVIREAGKVVTFESGDAKTFYTRPPVDFVLRIQNEGNVHFRPTGTITIRNGIGGTTTTLTMNSQQGAVLPGSIRRFDNTWEKHLNDAERGNFFEEIAGEWRNFAFGPYTATAAISYGQADDKHFNATFSFWVFPWRIMLVSILVLALLIWLIIISVRNYNRWIVNKAKGSK